MSTTAFMDPSTAGTFTLDKLVRFGDTSELPVTAFVGNNLGHRTLLMRLPMYDFFRMSSVANERGQNGEAVAQRKLDPIHAFKLGRYTLKGLVEAAILGRMENDLPVTDAHERIQRILGKQPYVGLQPVVVNIRTAGRNGSNLRGKPLQTDGNETVGFRLWLTQRDLLWVVDGQHRRMGMQNVLDFLEEVRVHQRYPTKRQSMYTFQGDDRGVPADELTVWAEAYEIARGSCTVSIEAHLGLNVEEERQLFYDLNNLAKRVEKSLALEFDSSNPVNQFIKEHLLEPGRVILVSGDTTDWEEDTGGMTRKDLVAVNAHLFLNKSNINGATPVVVEPRKEIAKRLWEAVLQIDGFGEERAKKKTVAAQPVVLKALAKLTYDFAFGRQINARLLDHLLDGITDVDFSHTNPMWRYYDLNESEREQHELQGLAQYLPDSSTANRDIGAFDTRNQVMRFGAKHNDIFPIIGDMIRWKLGLPSRHSLSVGPVGSDVGSLGEVMNSGD